MADLTATPKDIAKEAYQMTAKKKAPAKTSTKAVAAVRDPDARDRAAMELAAHRGIKRRWPVEVKLDKETGSARATHSDKDGHSLQLMDALGTISEPALQVMLGSLENVTRQRGEVRGENDTGLNFGLAFVEAVRPENEIEAALAIQMVGSSSLALEMLGRARSTDRLDHTERYANMAVKLQRVFTEQLAALSKLRGGGQQTVSVTHTHIDARGSQNAFAETITTTGRGGGANVGNGHQPHGPAADIASLAVTTGVPMRSAEPTGEAMPGAGHEG